MKLTNQDIRSEITEEMKIAAETKELFDTPEDKLNEWICGLWITDEYNEMSGRKNVVKALVINHIQMTNTLNKLNNSNAMLQGKIKSLQGLAVFVGVSQIIFSLIVTLSTLSK